MSPSGEGDILGHAGPAGRRRDRTERAYEPWCPEHVVIDPAGQDPQESVTREDRDP